MTTGPPPPHFTGAWFEETPQDRPFLAGISGGADSVALLHLLQLHGFRQVIVCHLNHRLRGAAAEEDAHFVAALAARLGYPCESGEADVAGEMALTGESLETAARQARHRFFAGCARRHACPRLLLAHHRDDQAETVLWNLLRGSHGPAGMKPVQTLTVEDQPLEIHRPLLGCSRAELVAFLEAAGQPWREDASNAEPIAIRNRLRHEALPLLSAIAGRDAGEALARAADGAAALREIQHWAVREARACDPQGRLHLPRLRELPPALQSACLHAFLSAAGVPDLSRDAVARCLGLLDPTAAPAVNLPGGRILRRRAGRLLLDP